MRDSAARRSIAASSRRGQQDHGIGCVFIDAGMLRTVEPGRFDLMVGSSSVDIRLKGSFEIAE